MGVCYIVGSAPHADVFSPKDEDLVIAADGGQKALSRMGIRPHLVVGDFDSSEAPKDIPFVKHPVEKDDTDTALAIREGARRGYRTFALYGCVGGRLDHTVGVIQTALGAKKQGYRVFLVGEGTVGTVLMNECFSFAPTGTVSVFALSERAEGVSLTGLKYPLENATLTNDFPLGVSNASLGGEASVSVKTGALYLLWEGTALSI